MTLNGVERCFNRALEVARGQSAKLLELRATASLARLWRDERRNDDPRGAGFSFDRTSRGRSF
jgi:hypothetical protein